MISRRICFNGLLLMLPGLLGSMLGLMAYGIIRGYLTRIRRCDRACDEDRQENSVLSCRLHRLYFETDHSLGLSPSKRLGAAEAFLL